MARGRVHSARYVAEGSSSGRCVSKRIGTAAQLQRRNATPGTIPLVDIIGRIQYRRVIRRMVFGMLQTLRGQYATEVSQELGSEQTAQRLIKKKKDEVYLRN